MTEKQVTANLRNALKSTGPRTSPGKSRSSKNAIKHGLLAANPVLPGIESPKEWEKFRAGIIKSLRPIGHLEKVLAHDIVIYLWKISRAERLEPAMILTSISTTELDMEMNPELNLKQPLNEKNAHLNKERILRLLMTIHSLPDMEAEKQIGKNIAADILCVLGDAITNDVGEGPPVPEILNGDAENFDGWTAHHLRKAVEAHAQAAEMNTEALLCKCISTLEEEFDEAKAYELEIRKHKKTWDLMKKREKLQRIFLDSDNLSRYVKGLWALVFKTLHELQRIQAARIGVVVTPPGVVDFDMTVRGGSPLRGNCDTGPVNASEL